VEIREKIKQGKKRESKLNKKPIHGSTCKAEAETTWGTEKKKPPLEGKKAKQKKKKKVQGQYWPGEKEEEEEKKTNV